MTFSQHFWPFQGDSSKFQFCRAIKNIGGTKTRWNRPNTTKNAMLTPINQTRTSLLQCFDHNDRLNVHTNSYNISVTQQRFSLVSLGCLWWDISKPDIVGFFEQASLHHPTISSRPKHLTLRKCFQTRLYTIGTRFNEKAVLRVKSHFKQMEIFQYTHLTHFTSCHPLRVRIDLSKKP